MQFNTKYIFQGDTKDEIVEKINYNFNQIVSFAVGPNGVAGGQGPTGFKGPAGPKGTQGASGQRATTWFKRSSQPTGFLNQYDLWVDTSSSNGEVNSYSATGSWNFTGFTIFDSTHFSSYNWILGPAGSTDKFVIGLSDTANAATQTLVVSDATVGVLDSNPNKSKVVVSTADQTVNPIFSFGKSGAISSGIPSFYWQNTGSSNDLIFKSNGGIDVTSLLDFNVNADLAAILLSGNDFNSYSSGFNLRGIGDFDFSANTTIGSGANFSVTSSNLTLTPQYLTHGGPIKISGSKPGGYALEDSPVSGQNSGGISLDVTFKTKNPFSFEDLTGNPIFYSKPSGAYNTGNFAQTIFGSTGGLTGGTGGPFTYHVQKTKNISLPSVSLTAYAYPSTTSPVTVGNVIDISSPSYWDRNVLVVTPASYTTTGGVYLRIPSTYLTNLSPVFASGKANYFRVLLNGQETDPSSVNILGLVFTFTDFSQNPNNPSSLISYINFGGSGCSFVDLQWLAVANANNANTRLFYKTCTGTGSYVNLANYYSVGATPPPTSLPSGGGGGGGYSGGGGYGGGGGCFARGTMISLANGRQKPIEEIQVGDFILSYDFERELLIEDLVENVFSVKRDCLAKIVLRNGVSIVSSLDHPYFLYSGEWASLDPDSTKELYSLKASALMPGCILMGDRTEPISIVQVDILDPGEYVVFNFHAGETQNYFANGVLVHNKTSSYV